MTEAEFDILDELYFVISFRELQKSVAYDEAVLIKTLKKLFEKKWLRILSAPDSDDVKKFPENPETYYFLASKKGLKAHNSM